MAVVISSEENSYFSSSTLRRSHSHNNFVTKNTGFHTSNSTSRINDSYRREKEFGTTSPSSAPSSPQVGPFDSYASTPATKLSVASDCDEDDQLRSISSEEHIILAQYDEAGYFNQVEDLEPPLSPRSGHSYTASPNDHDTSAATSRPESPDVLERAEDDIAIKIQPSRHVDYLSHDWREEDIWESWKLIVSKRGEYSNAARLENASWRTWMKAKNNLSTVSPETLNWLKDCDVTWLYGPLQTGTSSINPPTGTASSRLSKSNSFVKNKKPILKKRSMSEVMLQRSLSSLSLVKQAAAAVQAQQKEGGIRLGKRPGLERAATDFVTFPFSTRRVSHDGSLHPSMESSGVVSPGGGERKHIHFNEQVSQCIAVDVKDDEDEDEDDGNPFYDSDSDDDGIMMKRTSTKRKPLALKKKAKSAAPVGESKTIAMLPSTTLKYRSDTPDLPESAMKHSVYRSPVLSPSSSQETLRPAKKSSKMFFVDDEDEDDEDDEDDGPSIGWRSPTKFGEGSSGLVRSTSTSSLNAEPAGMRRTASGMFMPYEEGEPETSSEGMLGWMIDTKGASGDNTHRFRRGTSNASRGVR